MESIVTCTTCGTKNRTTTIKGAKCGNCGQHIISNTTSYGISNTIRTKLLSTSHDFIIERKINEFLSKNKVEILDIKFSTFYAEGNEEYQRNTYNALIIYRELEL
ncbi:sporulation protein Cse60 [Caldibacillus lycopersici]|uniref:Sporulation protein Cse60 n=1 Tax=Perspicuibacillus lycopersici TaxID=1325689 RepID=A0AAE3IPD5_9BACI|nr:sporulation protein Cse60 [Perspicuibacillus lycopersici]MCU9611977.1 sporulation protein Cse60 [Perspicuibacillus lycopersici]